MKIRLDPIIEQPEWVKIKLFEYQKKNIKWMLNKETIKQNIKLGGNNIIFDYDIMYNNNTKKLLKKKNSIEFSGGALINDQWVET